MKVVTFLKKKSSKPVHRVLGVYSWFSVDLNISFSPSEFLPFFGLSTTFLHPIIGYTGTEVEFKMFLSLNILKVLCYSVLKF